MKTKMTIVLLIFFVLRFILPSIGFKYSYFIGFVFFILCIIIKFYHQEKLMNYAKEFFFEKNFSYKKTLNRYTFGDLNQIEQYDKFFLKKYTDFKTSVFYLIVGFLFAMLSAVMIFFD